jgi:hypothetical protein
MSFQENLNKKQHAYESILDSKKSGAFEDESSEDKRGYTSYDDLLKTNKGKKYQEDETNDSKAQSLYEGNLSKKKSAGTDLDYSQGKKDQKGIRADEGLKKDQSGFDDVKKITITNDYGLEITYNCYRTLNEISTQFIMGVK